MTLPTKIAKRIAGICLWCTEPALDGSDYCGPHDAHERGQAANRQTRKRQKRAQAGLCVAGCGRKVTRRRKPDGSFVFVRCTGCKRRHRAEAKRRRQGRGVTSSQRGVTGSSSEADRTTREVEGDGYARTRFHGQPRRGQQKRHQLDLQDIDDAIDRLQRAKRGVVLAAEAEEAGVPRAQRDDIRFAAMSQASHARRFVEEVLERNGYDDREMIESVARTRG